MSDKDDGGSAFPIIDGLSADRDNGYTTYGDGGMSLRDYFAAKAMQGILSGSLADGSHLLEQDAETITKMAYIIADNMIKERKN